MSQLINAFILTGQRLRDAQSHWALMFFILALAVSLVYCILGYGTAIISTVSEYLQIPTRLTRDSMSALGAKKSTSRTH